MLQDCKETVNALFPDEALVAGEALVANENRPGLAAPGG